MRRRTFLQLASGGLMVPRMGLAMASSPKRLLVVYNHGGWDVSMLFDPKFESRHVQTASDGEVAEVGGLTFVDAPSRPTVSTFMHQYASNICIVNGVSVGSISHKKCEQLLLTGSRFANAPDFASIVASHNTHLPLPYSILSGPRITGNLGLNVSRVDQTFVSILRQEPRVDSNAVQAYVQQHSNQSSSQHISEYWDTLARQQQLRERLDLFPETLDGDSTTQIQVAMKLLANDVSAVSMVQVKPPTDYKWDSHDGNDYLQKGCFENLFTYLLYIAEQLESIVDSQNRPLVESTTVVVLSEMGRTPVYNANNGKDHWPFTSMMLFGQGVRGGSVVGASDDKLTASPIDLVDGKASSKGVELNAGHVVAGLLQQFDIDPAQYVDSTPFTAPFR